MPCARVQRRLYENQRTENANYRAEPESIGAERRGSSRCIVQKLGKKKKE
jgi:hypothetical protein